MKRLLLFIYILSCTSYLSAQEHDSQKYKQIRSMELGGWNFEPGWYYYYLHKKYSGADKHWQWQGLKSHFVVRFDEKRSDVKRVLPVREKASAEQLLKVGAVEEERRNLKEVYDEEVISAADRNVDLVYNFYQADFLRLNEELLKGFAYILKESKNKLAVNVTTLSDELNLINDHIAYIHKTGVGYELENAKREKAYIQAKKDLEALLKRTYHLALSARTLY